MQWLRHSHLCIKSREGHRVAKVQIDGRVRFEAWAPPGSGAEQMRHIEEHTSEALERFFGISKRVQMGAVAGARLRIGDYATADEARRACEGWTCG